MCYYKLFLVMANMGTLYPNFGERFKLVLNSLNSTGSAIYLCIYTKIVFFVNHIIKCLSVYKIILNVHKHVFELGNLHKDCPQYVSIIGLDLL
jgi:hypothetical protein